MLLTLNLDGAASTGVLDSTTTKALVPSLHKRLASTRGSLDACMHVSNSLQSSEHRDSLQSAVANWYACSYLGVTWLCMVMTHNVRGMANACQQWHTTMRIMG